MSKILLRWLLNHPTNLFFKKKMFRHALSVIKSHLILSAPSAITASAEYAGEKISYICLTTGTCSQSNVHNALFLSLMRQSLPS